MRAQMRALSVSMVLCGCYGGIEDEAGDELAATGTEVGDATTEPGDGDTTSNTTGEADSTATSTTDEGESTATSTTDEGESTATSTTDGESDTTSTTGGPEGCTPDALELIDLLNDYRAENGLPAIPASPSMCIVSTTHVHDLADNSPHTQPGGCNLHSWSDQGVWSPCCYTPDHAQAQCMWDKPSQLSAYPGYGYENAASGVSSPAQALELWKSSPPHNEVILNLGIWVDHPWQAIGADVHQGFSVLWFGEQVDPG